jgi:6-phosphogluconolactonase (cycloisomerase 2 family)
MESETDMGAVYVQTNEPENAVIAFGRQPDGSLTKQGSYPTGGRGDAKPHLTSQGSVVLTGDGRHLLVTNVASDDVSVFALGEGSPRLLGAWPTGPSPKSVAEHAGLVYVLSTGKASVSGFRLGPDGLEAIPGAEHSLSAPTADPAQVSFTPDGRHLVVTERGSDAIVIYEVGPDGRLGQMRVVPSSGATPYGFAFTPDGTRLVVTEAFRAQKGAAAASSYRLVAGELEPVTRSLGNGRSEICWAVITGDGRYAFTTNFADGAVSRYAIDGDGALTLDDVAAGMTEDGSAGLRDEDLTSDGRFLYAIDADAARIYGWAVGHDGSLSPIGAWDGVPATVAGLAAS